MARRRTWHRLAPALSVVALAALLRLVSLGTESLWVDEAASLHFVETFDLAGILFELPLTETHPPLYYAMLELWTGVFGTSPAALRLPSALLGIGSVALLYALGARLFGRRVGVLAAGLMALSRFHIYYAQEARMYSLLTFATILSFHAFVIAREQGTRRSLVAYAASAVFVGYTHVYGLLAIAAQAAIVAADVLAGRASWREQAPWIGAFSAVGVGLSAWLFVLGGRVLSSTGGVDKLSWIELPTVGDLLRAPAAFMGLPDVLGRPGLVLAFLVLAPLIVLGAASVRLGPRRGAPEPSWFELERTVGASGRIPAIWLAVCLLIPFALSYLLFPIYLARYTVLAGPAFFLLAAKAVFSIDARALRAVLAGILVTGAIAPLPTYYAEDQKEQWDEAAAFVADRAGAEDLVLVANDHPGWIQARSSLAYYLEREDLNVTGIEDQIEPARLERLLEDRERVWLVLSHMNEGGTERLSRLMGEEGFSLAGAQRFIGIQIFTFEQGPPSQGA